ncbi:MAG: TetR/AcrR family transcriptional regulator [Clostridiales bacterium]|nr:TetR/AcrR family transcriptional regulator [Clostridiales bacterium]
MPRSREQNAKIREESKTKILQKSIQYFAKNGVEGTKIGDLTKGIGISQGALYVYFQSKEDLYNEVLLFAQQKIASEELLQFAQMDVPAIRKLRYISDYILKKLQEEKSYGYHMLLALERRARGLSKEDDPLFDLMKSIIKEGQKDGSFAKGNAAKTAEYFWSVVYIYSVKKCNDPKCELLTSSELERVVRG